jgi:predicted O-methyltransferase YrrM
VLTPEALISNPPRLHQEGERGQLECWGLHPAALRSLSRRLQPGWRTLETGAGVSTILFAVMQTDHTCVVPSSEEVTRIKAFCAAREVSTARVTFVEERSEEALPRLSPGPLDLVLIDGSHSFPTVFIDWYYTASRLREGGWLLIDDTNLWTGRVLRDFLDAEEDWALVEEVPFRTATFQKRSNVQGVRNWVFQPYVVSHSVFTRRGRVVVGAQRRWASARRRLRQLVGRRGR